MGWGEVGKGWFSGKWSLKVLKNGLQLIWVIGGIASEMVVVRV
jgi:hypothetical protein